MIMKDFLQEFDGDDDAFISYHPVKPIKIFGFELDASMCEISISHNLNWADVAPILTQYLEWLASCENEVTNYFFSKLDEDTPDGWFESIEVFEASITFITLEYFGAIVSLGESILMDHTIEFTIDKFEIVEDALIG